MSTTTVTTHQAMNTGLVERQGRFVRAGVVAGLVAAAVNTVVAAAADAADISLVVERGGRPIPVLGFTNVTFVSALIGIGLAAILRRRSARPAAMFTRITVALTAVSLIPPVLVDARVSTTTLLIATHLIAAAIIIPPIANRLPQAR